MLIRALHCVECVLVADCHNLLVTWQTAFNDTGSRSPEHEEDYIEYRYVNRKNFMILKDAPKQPEARFVVEEG